ncbi:hypothetical protein BKA83DRAFT_4120837 [Pisolithus microcarpus]|nr:hypothetical protein BKA83DRAFT_4120837 [Pisolithus microcarpus]
MSQVPHGWWMQLTEKLAEYMQSQFWEEVFTGQRTIPNKSIPVPLKNVWDSLNLLRVPLEESIKKSRNHGWRNDRLLFRKTTDLVGSIDLSPGWYQQGHGPPDFHPEVSRLLKSGWECNGAWQWVNEMSEFHALLLGTLAVIHPQMYAAGQEALIQLDMEVK